MVCIALLLAVFSAASVPAQTAIPNEAAALIADAAAAASATTSWYAQGKLTGEGSEIALPGGAFTISYKLPRPVRLELNAGDSRIIRVCDGSAQYTYYPDVQGVVRVLLPQIGPCAFPINGWAPLRTTLQSPVMAGTEVLTVDGKARTCQIVRGAYTWTGRDAQVKETVTVCIDREDKRILSYQLQHSAPGPAWSQTYTFTSLQLNPPIDPNVINFKAPEGSRLFATIDWLTPIANRTAGVQQVSNQVSAPILTNFVPPIAPAEAALVEGSGTVMVRVEIGKDGKPHDIQVSRSAGPGFDEAAAKCVQRWRFQPAESASGEVAVAATIQIHFSQPAGK